MRTDIHKYTLLIDLWELASSFFLHDPHSVSKPPVCVWVFALSTVAISISVANLQAYFRTIFLQRLQSSLFLLITVEPGWHVREDKAVFFPSSAAMSKNVFTVVSTNECWRPRVECLFQIDALTTYIFAFLWYAPYFRFCSVRNMALLLARFERKRQTKSKFAYVIPMMLDSPV